MRLNIFILLTIIFWNSHIFSQEKNTWFNYTTSQRVMDIEICDSNVWVATFGGLVKYNYYNNTKKNFTRANANLPDNNVNSLSFDNNGNLWLASMYYGIGKFNNNWCINYYESNSGLPSNQWNTKIKVDDENAIWIASMNYVVKYDKGKWYNWELGNQTSSSFSINDILPDNNGGVWIANSQGLGKFEKGKYSKLNDIVGPVYCLKPISKNKFWIGTQLKGLYLYNNGSLKSYNSSNSTIPTNSIISLAIDNQGNTWFPAGNKLIKYNNAEFIKQQSINEFSDDIIITIDVDNNNNVWCGTFKGKLYRYKDSSFEEINISNSVLRNNYVNDLALNDTAIYISTNNNLVLKSANKFYSLFNTNNHISNTYISNIATSKLNDIWISFSYGDTCLLNINKKTHSVFDSTNSLFNQNSVFNDIVADSNIVWFATNNGLYSYSNYEFIEFKTDNCNIPSNSVLCLFYDSNNILWGGTDNGLFKFDGFSWQTWNTSNSPIPTNIVNCIYGSSDGEIWFACMDENRITGDKYGGGLTVLYNSTMQTFNINNSPIPSNTIFDIYVDSSNNIWLGACWKGLVKFNGTDKWNIFDVFNSGLSHNNITKIILKDNMIWIAHSHGGVSVANIEKIDSDIRTLYFKDQKKNDLLELFPNPIINAFQIKFSDSTILPISIKAFDITGKLLHQNQIISETTEQQYLFLISELNILNDGIYIIQVQTNKGMYSKRILVAM